MKRRIDVRKRLKESFDKDRYEKISGKTVNDVDGFSTDYTLYFDHNENNYFTVFGDNELYGPDSEHDWDFGSNEDEAWEWFDDYEGFNQDDVDDAFIADVELTDDDLQAGQWYESLNKKPTSKKSCNEGLLFRDNGAGLADKGYLFTLQELGKIYDDCIKAKDPVVMEYKNFSDWMNDTVDSGLLEIVDERAFDESLNEDTVKQGNAWVNKGKEGTHGKFKTKKAADAQRRAMFAQGFKTKRK